MYLKDYDYVEEEEINPAKIIWETKDRYAIIAFLLLAADGKLTDDGLIRLNKFIGIGETPTEDEAEKNKYSEQKPAAKGGVPVETIRDYIVSHGQVFLNSIEQEESFSDCLIDELDNIIEGKGNCNIGDAYSQYNENEDEDYEDMDYTILGSAALLFEYVKLIDGKANFSGRKKRLLQHLSRKWKLDKSFLPVMVTSIDALNEIRIKRTEIKGSDKPYREASSILETLEADEKAVWEKLHSFGVTDDNNYSTHGKRSFGLSNLLGLGEQYSSIFNQSCYERKGPVKPKEANSEKRTVIDDVGDVIVEGICKIGEAISAPFEWLSGVR